jgi:delta24-sterol reductase
VDVVLQNLVQETTMTQQSSIGTKKTKPPREKRPASLADFVIQFRWIVAVPILLPISFLFYQWMHWRAAIRAYLYGPPSEKKHSAEVQKVQASIRKRNPTVDGLICTARAPWLGVALRNSEHKRSTRYEVELGGLSSIVWIDTNRKLMKCEPMVVMSELSNATLPLGLAPEVLPELDDLTVGGVINGYGIEGSSHIYGLFAETCTAFELVLADGTLVRATADNEYSDLFDAVPWSHGSLGLLVGVEFRLIEIKDYMRVTYTPVHGDLKDVAQAFCDAYCPRDLDQDNPKKVPEFVEGIVYSETEAVITTGQYASKREAQQKGNVINPLGRWYKPWFHIHAQTALTQGSFVEYVPVRQYYHRHTRSIYWEGGLIVPMGNHPLFRFFLGWLMPPKVSILKLTQNDAIRRYYIQRHACQDMLVPNHKLAEALEFCHETFETYPVWLCPHRLFKKGTGTMLDAEKDFDNDKYPGDTDYAQMFTDVGIWGVPGPVIRQEVWDGVQATLSMEKWLRKNNSYQCLYAVIEQSEEEFWKMFNPTLYTSVRKK